MHSYLRPQCWIQQPPTHLCCLITNYGIKTQQWGAPGTATAPNATATRHGGPRHELQQLPAGAAQGRSHHLALQVASQKEAATHAAGAL